MAMIMECRQHVVTAGHCIKNKQLNNLNVTLGEVYYTMISNNHVNVGNNTMVFMMEMIKVYYLVKHLT